MAFIMEHPFDLQAPDRARQVLELHSVKEQRGNWVFCLCGTALSARDHSAHIRDALREAGIALITDKYVHRLTSGIESLLAELALEMTPDEFARDGRELLGRRYAVHAVRHLFGVPCGPDAVLNGPEDGTDLVSVLREELRQHEITGMTFSEGSGMPDISCSCGEVVPGISHGEHQLSALGLRGLLLTRHDITLRILGLLCISVRMWDTLCGSGNTVAGMPSFPDDYSRRLHELAEYTDFLRDELAIRPSD